MRGKSAASARFLNMIGSPMSETVGIEDDIGRRHDCTMIKNNSSIIVQK